MPRCGRWSRRWPRAARAHEAINVLAPIVSPADLRYLKAVFRDFGLEPILLPDYSDTLDGPAWTEYQRIPPGGTPLDIDPPHGLRPGDGRIRRRRTRVARPRATAWKSASACRAMPCRCRSGVTQVDRLFDALASNSAAGPSPHA